MAKWREKNNVEKTEKRISQKGMKKTNNFEEKLCAAKKFCEKKGIEKLETRGRKCGVSLAEVLAVQVAFHRSRCKDFKTFYCGIAGEYLRMFLPKMPSYSAMLKQVKKLGAILGPALKKRRTKSRLLIIDSTPLPVCHKARANRHKTFAGEAKWAHSSVSVTFGLKLHLVTNLRQKILNFELKPGNLHDVSCAEEILAGLKGTAIGDGGYVSESLQERLKDRGLTFVAKHRCNMVPNSPEEKKLLKKRSIVETVIGKFKHWFGFSLSRFRSPEAAYSDVCTAIFTVNFCS